MFGAAGTPLVDNGAGVMVTSPDPFVATTGTRTSLMALALTALLIGLALLLRSERCGALARG
jgi:hypothetical protein